MLGLPFNPEDGGRTVFRNVGRLRTDCTVSDPRCEMLNANVQGSEYEEFFVLSLMTLSQLQCVSSV
jgi:hypothetical protein